MSNECRRQPEASAPGRNLAERLRFLEAALVASAEGIFVADAQGCLVFFNQAAAEIAGRWPSGGKPMPEQAPDIEMRYPDGQVVPPADTPLRRAMRGEKVVGRDIVIRRPDGSDVYASITASPVRDEQGNVIGAVAIFRNSTERKRAEETANRLAAIVESSDDAVIGKALDGTIFSWNSAAERLYGYSAAEALGKSIAIIIPPERSAELRNILETARHGKVTKLYETQRVRKDGSRVAVSVTVSPIIDAHGRILGASTVARDITEASRARREIERLAEESRRRAAALQSILDNMVDGVFVCDAQGRITLGNTSGRRMLGLTRAEEALGPLSELLRRLPMRDQNGKLLSVEEMPLSRALQGETIQAFDQIYRNPQTARDVHMRVSAAPIRDEKGRIVGAVSVLRDVTELTELERLKDQFINVAAHELKTPVTVMKGYAQMLLRSADTPTPARQRMLEAINRGADRIDRVVKDLLDVSRLHLGRLEMQQERLNLVELVQQIVDQVSLTTGRTMRITRAETAAVQGDRERVGQVLTNLLDNAVKYSPRGGDVEVALSIQGQEAVVSVTDHGVGIPKEKQPHVFERFYRAHAGTPYDFGGMGIGLYISKQIIERHGGRIWFQSEEGKGSTFYFSLPLRGTAKP